MNFRMVVLILVIFCVGTSELSPSGRLGEVARDSSVTILTAGLLVRVHALSVAVDGPITAEPEERTAQNQFSPQSQRMLFICD